MRVRTSEPSPIFSRKLVMRQKNAKSGLQGVTAIDAWDTAGDRMADLEFPVSFASRIEVSLAKDIGGDR